MPELARRTMIQRCACKEWFHVELYQMKHLTQPPKINGFVIIVLSYSSSHAIIVAIVIIIYIIIYKIIYIIIYNYHPAFQLHNNHNFNNVFYVLLQS